MLELYNEHFWWARFLTYEWIQLTCKIVTSIFSVLMNCMQEADIEKVIPKEMTEKNTHPSHDPAILPLGIFSREISAYVQNSS